MSSSRFPTMRRTAFVISFVVGLSSIATFVAPTPVFAWDSSSFSSSSEKELVALTNQSRASAGLKALKVDSTLTSVARWRSKDMIDRDYFSHDIPGYGSVFKKLDSKGYCYKVAGENIGWNNYPDDVATSAIHQMFMDSSGHRANIMGKAWDVIGIGAYKAPDGRKMWTVLFADKCGTTATATPKPTPKPTPKATPKPTPKPTPKATPKAVPASTPKPTPKATARAATAEPTAPASPSPTASPTPSSSPASTLSPRPTPTPSSKPGDDGDSVSASAAGETGLRIVAPAASVGLLETIVGGVTGLFFGG